MLQITINKTTGKATTIVNGKEQALGLVKVNKATVKPGTYWVNLQALGTPRKWQTVNFNDYEDDVFVVDVDETAHREIMRRAQTQVTLTNIRDFLDEEHVAVFNELFEMAQAECAKRVAEHEAQKPVKEKKSRKMSNTEKIAKLLAEAERLRKIEAGELPPDEPKPRKSKKAAVVLEDLDAPVHSADSEDADLL